MNHSIEQLTDFVLTMANKYSIPGVAVGVWANDQEYYATHGVTSLDNPLPININTLFILGSVTKSYTATALMRLVSEGKVDINAPVRTYVPEFKLADEQAAESITVLHLLNHTSGLDWGLITDTGEGDDALASYIQTMSELKQLALPGTRTSYSQAGYNLVGRVIEKITGLTFERAVASILFNPLGMSHSFFDRDDVMTRRFCVGHNRREDGSITIARLWRRSRGDNPGGGIASSVADQLRWARLHLNKDTTDARVLPAEILSQMQQPTAELNGSNLGDAIGVGWFLRTLGGIQTVGHAGSANGQFAELLLVPERNFAVVSLSNCGPDGITFNQQIIRWALKHYLNIIDNDIGPLPFSEVRASEIVGSYENEVMTLRIYTVIQDLQLEVLIKPAIRAASDKELPPDHEPFYFGLLPGNKDEYIITSGAFGGQRGYFTRDNTQAVIGVDLAGRLFHRI